MLEARNGLKYVRDRNKLAPEHKVYGHSVPVTPHTSPETTCSCVYKVAGEQIRGRECTAELAIDASDLQIIQ